jgi:hypothetical protein
VQNKCLFTSAYTAGIQSSEGTYCIHLQGRSASQTGKQHEAGSKLHTDFLLRFLFDPEVETICSSGTSIEFHRAARCYIPEDTTYYSQRY